MYCRNCGNKLKDNDKFCIVCGTSTIESVEGNARKKYLWGIIGVVVCVVIMIVTFVFKNNGDAEETSNLYSAEMEIKTVDSERILFAEQVVKRYLQEDYLDGIIGAYFEFSDVNIITYDDGSFKGYFDAKKLNRYINDDSDLYYIEFFADESGIYFGYSVSKEFAQYMQEAYGAPLVEYTIGATWDGEYDVLVDEETSNEETYISNIELNNDNIIEFSNGLKIIIPVSWVGKVVASENNTSYSIYEAQNYEQGNWEFGPPGRLFDVLLVFNYSEVDASPNHSVLGYFYDGNMAIGMIVDYPTDISYDPENEKLSDAYLEIADSLQEVQFDISGIEGFVECDEDELRSVLSE